MSASLRIVLLAALVLQPPLVTGCIATDNVAKGVRRAATGKTYAKKTKTDRECARVPACQAYLDKIRERVYELWKPDAPLAEGRVVIEMRLDSNGTPTSMKTLRADTPELARSCRAAIGYAEPFGLLPVSLAFLRNQEITIEFVYRPRTAAR